MSDNPLSYNPDDATGRRPQPRFQRKQERSGGLWQILLALASVAIFAGVVWYFFVVEDASRTPPQIILSDGQPFKRKPDQPTGMIVPDQDKLVYDEVSGNRGGEAEDLMPAPEEPMARPEPAVPDTDTAPAAAAPELPPNTMQPRSAPAGSADAAPKPSILPEPAQTATAGPDWGSVYRLQIGSYRSVEAAKDAWAAQRKKYPSFFASPDAEVQKADLGDRGTYYRLRAGKYTSRAEASVACTELKGLGGDCLIVAPDS